MVLLELFSGIGGFSMGLQAAGYSFEKVFFSEIEKHAIANFKYNFPYAEHIGSVTDIAKVGIARPDIITFGSPCQNFSAVGDGTGLRGEASSLVRYAVEAVGKFRPDVFIWENVKGILFARHRADFWSIIKAFADIGGYRLEWQLLNTAWFLPQSRERMYLVGRLAEKCAGEVFLLFPPREKHGKGKQDSVYSDGCGTITQNYYKQPNFGNYILHLKAGETFDGTPTSEQSERIRMLTETECERLHGFPDGHTRYGVYEDGSVRTVPRANRYAMLGNAVSVPVVAEVARKIKETTLF